MAGQEQRSFAAKVSSAVRGAGSDSKDPTAALVKFIGSRVKIVLAQPKAEVREGSLWTADPETNLIVLNSAAKGSPTANFHFFPISNVASFSVLDRTPNGSHADVKPLLARLDVKALDRRIDAAIQKIKERDATRGKSVTQEAQDIFDALARTLPVRWHESSMIVNDAVRIDTPYGVNDCRASKENQNALARVKRVLENERRKLAERNAAAGSRKGG